MYTNTREIDSSKLDQLIQDTYGRPYRFQQQDGCQGRGAYHIDVPGSVEDFERDSVPEKLNGEEMGVSFQAWLARDPKTPVGDRGAQWEIDLFWGRNFYPSQSAVLNDLHEKGLIEAGEYTLIVDW